MIVFDNIVYRIQKAGGVSVYWAEMCKNLEKDNTTKKLFIEDSFAKENIARKTFSLDETNLLTRDLPLFRLARYFRVKINLKGKFIFHSSYFRTCLNKSAINVTTVYDFIYERYDSGPKKWLHTFIKKRAIKNSKAVICISESTKRDLLNYYPNFDREKLHVIHLSASDSFFPIKGTTQNLPFVKNKFLLFVGQRYGYKGFSYTVEMAKEFNLKLVAVGGGELNKSEKQMICDKLGPNAFRHLGNVSSSNLNELYNNAFCLFYPSTYEGFGVPLIEAQKAGCPVIAFNGSSINEVVLQSALLIREHSKASLKPFIEVLNNPVKRNEIIESGFINSKRFSWEKSYAKLKAVYEELLNA